MQASARLAVARDGKDAPTRITCLRSDPPFVLRPTSLRAVAPLHDWHTRDHGIARVSRAAGAAGPIGGDVLRLNIEVGEGAALVLRSVAATLALPGPHRTPSFSETSVTVAAGGTLLWFPGTMIAARGCQHRAVTRINLAPGARLFLRDELLLGRHGEQPGAIRQRVRVCIGDRAIHDQELAVDPMIAGWEGPAVTGGRRAMGSVLMVDPRADSSRLPGAATESDVAVLPLNEGGLLITALADNALTLRRRLEGAIVRVFEGGWLRCTP